MTATLTSTLTPARILETATSFWQSKVLLTAVELGVFTQLAKNAEDNQSLEKLLGIRAGRSADFFDALVALGFLHREGDGPQALYFNTAETDLFLDRNKPTYIGGLPEMLNGRLFGFWNGLTDALRTGSAQNETQAGGRSMFGELYADSARLEQFLDAMASLQVGNCTACSTLRVQSLQKCGRRGWCQRTLDARLGSRTHAPRPRELRSPGRSTYCSA